MDNIWSIVFFSSLGGVAAVVGAILLQSAAVIGIYVFSVVFWAAYGNLFSILSIGNYLTGIWGFVGIGTGVMLFVFIAAIIGMLSSSG